MPGLSRPEDNSTQQQQAFSSGVSGGGTAPPLRDRSVGNYHTSLGGAPLLSPGAPVDSLMNQQRLNHMQGQSGSSLFGMTYAGANPPAAPTSLPGAAMGMQFPGPLRDDLLLRAMSHGSLQSSQSSINPYFMQQDPLLSLQMRRQQLLLQSLREQEALELNLLQQRALQSMPLHVSGLGQPHLNQPPVAYVNPAQMQQQQGMGSPQQAAWRSLPIPPSGRETFPEKLYRMLFEVERDGLTNVISFTPSGTGVMIHNPKAFESEVAKNYFKHGNVLSFQRQLYLYGFEKQFRGPDKGAYVHAHFQRGKPENIHMILRRQRSEKDEQEQADIMEMPLNRLPFPQKLYRLLVEASEKGMERVIRWEESGEAFRILDVLRFRELILPQYFKHKQMSSFRRQLDLYGFKRDWSDGGEGTYAHPSFLRGKPELLSQISRRCTTSPEKGSFAFEDSEEQEAGDISANEDKEGTEEIEGES